MGTVTGGHVTVSGRRTWVRRVVPDATDHAAGSTQASPARTPLIVVHGGPGLSHDYLTDLDRLADLPGRGREVIYYDQAGCGRSESPPEPTTWSLDLFADELSALVSVLGLDRYDVLGHSAGGWIALTSALREPPGLRRLVLASTCADMPLYRREVRLLKDALPDGLGAVIDRCEADGTTDSPEYAAAFGRFQSLHVLCGDTVPANMLASLSVLNETVYNALLGPEWNMTGSLKNWTVADQLGRLDLPVLVTSGRSDEMTLATVAPMAHAVRGARWRVFEHSAHMSMMEEPDDYARTVASFLDRG